MRVLPMIEMTEDDPRWLQMQRDKVEARIRFGQSEQARQELEQIRASAVQPADWTVKTFPPQESFHVIPWD